VKRAAADQVLAAPLERDARRLDQALQGDLFLQPLDLMLGDARHDVPQPLPVK